MRLWAAKNNANPKRRLGESIYMSVGTLYGTNIYGGLFTVHNYYESYVRDSRDLWALNI